MCIKLQNFIIFCFIYLAFFPKIVILFEEFASKDGSSSIALKSSLPIVPLCLLKCKDNHMLQMESEWSSDFVFPLNDLLRSGASSAQMSEKVNKLCRHNFELSKCVGECPSSVENEIMQLGLIPWQNICENLRDMETQFGCWKRNVDSILLECSFESQKLRFAIESFTRNVSVQLVEKICIDLAHLSDCFEGAYGKHCGQISKKLVGTLFTNSREAIVKMLRMKWAEEVPQKCGPKAVRQANANEQRWALGNGTSAAWPQCFIRPTFLFSSIFTRLILFAIFIFYN